METTFIASIASEIIDALLISNKLHCSKRADSIVSPDISYRDADKFSIKTKMW